MKVKGSAKRTALLGTTSTKVQELKQRIEKKLLTQQKLHEMSSGDISSEIAKLNNESSVFDLAELQSALQSINP